MIRPRFRNQIACLLALTAAVSTACATNPVTGRRELMLISEAQEIQMGHDADKEVAAAYGLYPEERVQLYVQRLGAQLAATCERPNLPWTFRVVDDASVNAFAIPGGFIYLTRGIMTHLNSEAEMVAILGHEMGHVTARHSVSQMSRQQLAQIGLVAGMVLSPRFARFGNLAQTAMGLMFLKFSRSDESEADRLGFKYMVDGGYDPRRMADVFRMLNALSAQQGGDSGRLPQWMSTHPDPGNRLAWATQTAAALNRDLSQLTVNRVPYLQRVDGMVFGENPREGIFQESTFRHPDMAFRIEFPRGWKGVNQKQAVGAVSPQQDAVVVLQLSGAPNPSQAARQFLSQEGLQAGESWTRQIGRFPTVSATFQATAEEGTLQGLVAWVEYQNRVFEMIGYTSQERWPQYNRVMAQAIASFDQETDRAVLNVQPARLNLIELNRPSTLDALMRDYPSTAPPQVIALINNLQGAAPLPAGERFKRVVGGEIR